MQPLIIVALIIIVALVIKFVVPGIKISGGTSRPPADEMPSVEKNNDKLIIIKNVAQDDVRKVLKAFCDRYNKDSYQAMPRLYKLSASLFAVTFPYDIDFAIFCFAVNFLEYPDTDVDWRADVRAWATTKSGDEWTTKATADQFVMLYIDKVDKEYDNVFMTTQDNIGYKLDFGARTEEQLPSPTELFVAPAISISELKELRFEDFS